MNDPADIDAEGRRFISQRALGAATAGVGLEGCCQTKGTGQNRIG